MPHINITFLCLPCTQVFYVYASHRYNMPNYILSLSYRTFTLVTRPNTCTQYCPIFHHIHISYCNNSLVLQWTIFYPYLKIQNIFQPLPTGTIFFYLFSSLSKGRGILPLISHTYIILKIKYHHNLFFSNNFKLRTILNTLFHTPLFHTPLSSL